MKVRVAACEGSHFFCSTTDYLGDLTQISTELLGGNTYYGSADFLCSNTDYHG